MHSLYSASVRIAFLGLDGRRYPFEYRPEVRDGMFRSIFPQCFRAGPSMILRPLPLANAPIRSGDHATIVAVSRQEVGRRIRQRTARKNVERKAKPNHLDTQRIVSQWKIKQTRLYHYRTYPPLPSCWVSSEFSPLCSASSCSWPQSKAGTPESDIVSSLATFFAGLILSGFAYALRKLQQIEISLRNR